MSARACRGDWRGRARSGYARAAAELEGGASGAHMNPLDTIKGTLIAGFVLAIVLVFVIRAIA